MKYSIILMLILSGCSTVGTLLQGAGQGLTAKNDNPDYKCQSLYERGTNSYHTICNPNP